MLSAAINTRVLTLDSASEGGPYGMAILASYYLNKEENETLEDYLDNKVFINAKSEYQMASDYEIESFNDFYNRFVLALEVEKMAIIKTKSGE